MRVFDKSCSLVVVTRFLEKVLTGRMSTNVRSSSGISFEDFLSFSFEITPHQKCGYFGIVFQLITLQIDVLPKSHIRLWFLSIRKW